MSYPEVLLWQRLRRSAGGIKFRRQHPVGSDYVVNFFCNAACLVIEVDGQVHAHRIARDATRDRYLTGAGLRMLRIDAADVLRDADGTADTILRFASMPLHQPTAGPPPRSGEDQE